MRWVILRGFRLYEEGRHRGVPSKLRHHEPDERSEIDMRSFLCAAYLCEILRA